jgi:hypothetical protein
MQLYPQSSRKAQYTNSGKTTNDAATGTVIYRPKMHLGLKRAQNRPALAAGSVTEALSEFARPAASCGAPEGYSGSVGDALLPPRFDGRPFFSASSEP